MLALARYTLKGPYQAAGVVGLLAVLAVILPPLTGNALIAGFVALLMTVMAAILVGLIILTQGMVPGMKVIAAAMIGVTAVTWLLLATPEQAIAMALAYWLPIMLLAQVLRSSKSLAMMLLAGVGICAAGILLLELNWDNLVSLWTAFIEEQTAGEIEGNTKEDLDQFFHLARLLAMPSLYLVVTLLTLAARWIQGRLGDSEAFGQEFQRMQFGRSIALVSLIVVAVCYWLQQPWTSGVATLVIIAFMYQGIAVVHNRMAKKKLPTAMFVLFYLVFLLGAQITLILASITGAIDNWLDLRSLNRQAN